MTATTEPLDLRTPCRVHIIGVGGAGMSAIAEVLVAMGHRVSGSDLKDSATLERLRASGVQAVAGHDPTNLPDDVDVVAISTAIPERNTELQAARTRGVRVAPRWEVLAAVAATRRTVAVAGTHGKTTTSSMLALVLLEAGLSPSFIIGGDVNEIGSGSAWVDGELFVVEADESDGTFLTLPCHAAVVTSVEPDHLEHYGGWAPLVDAFATFVGQVDGPVVVCADDEGAAALANRPDIITYGTSDTARHRIVDLRSGRDGCRFTFTDGPDELGEVVLPVPGAHNARNAAAALSMALALGATFDAGGRALARFGGVARRFEHRGQAAGVTFVDDYAHLPSEVAAALSAAADGGWKRIVCVFQPHRYSRTQQVAADFAASFDAADLLAVTDIYPAGENPRPGVSGHLVVDAVLDHDPHRELAYLPHRADVVAWLEQRLRPGDLCLTLGAGDLTTAPSEVQARLADRDGPGR